MEEIEEVRQRLSRVRDGEFLTKVYGPHAEAVMAHLASDLDAILLYSSNQTTASPVVWRTCGMSGDRWTPWEMCSEERAKRWMFDPAFKNGRRKIEPLYSGSCEQIINAFLQLITKNHV